MKSIIQAIKAEFPSTEEQEIKRAYWRHAKTRGGVGHEPLFHITEYMKTNKMLKP